MNIALTEYWTSSIDYVNYPGTMLSDHYMRLYPFSIGKGRMYITTGNKFELKAIIVKDQIIYLDFSAPQHILEQLQQQAWILKHLTGKEYTIERCSIWEKFNLPTVDQLNEFAKIWHTVIN